MSSQRLHALDSLRAFAMLLGVFFHAAISFMVTDFEWAIKEKNPHHIFDVFVAASHGFRMQLFFLLAGYFGALLLDKLGTKGFILHRLKRIGLPFLLGMILLLPMLGVLFIYGAKHSVVSAPDFINEPPKQIPTAHLWFLCYLLYLYALTLAVVLLAKRFPEKLKSRLAFLSNKLLLSNWKIPLLAFLTFLLMLQSEFFSDIGIPGFAIAPIAHVLLYYWLFFGVGWLIYQCADCVEVFSKSGFALVGIGMIALLIMLPCLYFDQLTSGGLRSQLKIICNAAYSLYNWVMVFGITGLFLRYFNGQTAWSRYLADAAYWVYLMHLPLIIYLQIESAKLPGNLIFKFVAVNAICIGILLLTYHWGVRYTWVGRMLNGPRAKPLKISE